jgi:site-specific DNA recombinase
MPPDWPLAEEPISRDDGSSGAKLPRPGLERWQDRAAVAAFAQGRITAPDRLARHDGQHLLLSDARRQRGCRLEVLDRPRSQDPHDQLLLHMRGAVAE